MPMHTIQLQAMADTNERPKLMPTLASAMATVLAAATPSVKPTKCPRKYAIHKAPAKLPKLTISQLRIRLATLILLPNQPSPISIILPVASSPPPIRIQIRQIGNTAAPSKLARPDHSGGIPVTTFKNAK